MTFIDGKNMFKQGDLEHNALRQIVRAGKKGMLQSELWRKLGASSRWGSRMALKLTNKGLIRRERELSNGRWTYRLYPKRLPASIDSILDSPCLTCTEDSRCGALSTVTPNGCDKLTMWLLELANKEVDSLDEN